MSAEGASPSSLSSPATDAGGDGALPFQGGVMPYPFLADAARRLTSGEPQQQTASLTWIYDLVEYFPRVVVTVMYKCSWCFPASPVPTLSAEDRALRERHRSGRRGNDAVDPDDPGVVSLCPGPPGHPFGTDLAKCRGRIREVASFDSCASGNTKEIGAFLRHMLARNASGTLAAQTLLLHSSPGDHFVKVSNAYNEAATNLKRLK